MTEILFICLLYGCAGGIFGKYFLYKLNPILMLVGLIIFAPLVVQSLHETHRFYLIAFCVGIALGFKGVFTVIVNIFSFIWIYIDRWLVARIYIDSIKKREEKTAQAEEKIRQERVELEEEWERIQAEWDKLKRAKQRQGSDSKNHQHRYSQSRKNSSYSNRDNISQGSASSGGRFDAFFSFDLDNFNNNDPYAVLGVSKGSSKADIKRAYKKIMSRFHPDKFANESIEVIEEANKIAQLINWAWGEVGG